jgi:hypothetical protein
MKSRLLGEIYAPRDVKGEGEAKAGHAESVRTAEKLAERSRGRYAHTSLLLQVCTKGNISCEHSSYSGARRRNKGRQPSKPKALENNGGWPLQVCAMRNISCGRGTT